MSNAQARVGDLAPLCPQDRWYWFKRRASVELRHTQAWLAQLQGLQAQNRTDNIGASALNVSIHQATDSVMQKQSRKWPELREDVSGFKKEIKSLAHVWEQGRVRGTDELQRHPWETTTSKLEPSGNCQSVLSSNMLLTICLIIPT